ncbi:unnamed protein product [Prorocentrum cordatum]|uniref:Apple domain-containing protein n=1 Tax=Prorocentrum cordatum TaxID=2364126 RepID=A0ABN9W7U1_9DINO|nr:unnamed protein product [Polarella glacialis]|mmetsp:Transcript_52723/g.137356  ORF Transcript_52723/g.137356 Transcript_52723/m.137356 type:complete len:530 (-) Transcript_52723:210-1799(-)
MSGVANAPRFVIVLFLSAPFSNASSQPSRSTVMRRDVSVFIGPQGSPTFSTVEDGDIDSSSSTPSPVPPNVEVKHGAAIETTLPDESAMSSDILIDVPQVATERIGEPLFQSTPTMVVFRSDAYCKATYRTTSRISPETCLEHCIRDTKCMFATFHWNRKYSPGFCRFSSSCSYQSGRARKIWKKSGPTPAPTPYPTPAPTPLLPRPLKMAKASLSKARAASNLASAAKRAADESLKEQAETLKRAESAQKLAMEAHEMAKAAGRGSRKALTGARSANDEAGEALKEAQQADDNAEKLGHLVKAQNRTMHSLNHTVVSLNLTMQKVSAMQVVDESLLNATNRTTEHLGKVLDTQKKTLTTLGHMQEVDHHTMNAVNSTIQAIQLEMSKTKKDTENLKDEQKTQKIVSYTAMAIALLYWIGQKVAGYIAVRAAAKAKDMAFASVRVRAIIQLTVRGNDGSALFGPEDLSGGTQLLEVVERMPPPPEGERWEFVSSNISLSYETHVYEIGDGTEFTLMAVSVSVGDMPADA